MSLVSELEDIKFQPVDVDISFKPSQLKSIAIYLGSVLLIVIILNQVVKKILHG